MHDTKQNFVCLEIVYRKISSR